MVDTQLRSALMQLSDRMRVKRETGLSWLEQILLSSGEPELWRVASDHARQLIDSEPWESRHGGFLAAKMIIGHDREGLLAEELQELALRHLEDKEPLVRLVTGECLGVLAQQKGSAIYLSSKDRVLKSIGEDAPNPNVEEDADAFTGIGTGHKQEVVGVRKFQETSLRALQHLMEGCADDYDGPIEPLVLQLIMRSLHDKNHFVREAGFSALCSLCHMSNAKELKEMGSQIVDCLVQGLTDSWSPVRFEASKAVRMFMMKMFSYQPDFLPKLLPPMCLNRYYGAEGVRLYSQETWKTVLGTGGRQKVQECIDSVITYYLQEVQASSPLVREATCYCITEIVSKVDHQVLSPYVQPLVAALTSCFKDPSWSVRDAACSALGRIISEFPEESRSYLPQLYELWIVHLADNVSSVRENSAFALGSAMRTYNEDAINKVFETLQELLLRAKEQPSDTDCCSRHKQVKILYMADSQRQTSGHGSPEATARCGCPQGEYTAIGDHGFARREEPWEASDGAIYLLRELTSIAPDRAMLFLPKLADLGYCTNFRQHPYLLETLYRLLPSMAQNLGKKRFKPFLDIFIEPLFKTLSCGQRVAETAAGFCVSKLLPFIGPNVFKARLSEDQLRVLATSPFVRSDVPLRQNDERIRVVM